MSDGESALVARREGSGGLRPGQDLGGGGENGEQVRWTDAPPLPLLSPETGAVQVWRLDLEADPALVQAVLPALSPEEQARVEQARHPGRQAEIALGRALLRCLLGLNTGHPPRALVLAADRHGKLRLESPRLRERSVGGDGERDGGFETGPEAGSVTRAVRPDAPCPQGRGHGLAFNVSHSGEVLLVALARDLPVGVDVERIRPRPALSRLTARYFSTREQAAIRALPPEERLGAFFRVWARKEAVVKCDGRGVGAGLSRFDVTVEASPPRISGWRLDGAPATTWSLTDLPMGARYAGALALAGPSRGVSLLRLSPDRLLDALGGAGRRSPTPGV